MRGKSPDPLDALLKRPTVKAKGKPMVEEHFYSVFKGLLETNPDAVKNELSLSPPLEATLPEKPDEALILEIDRFSHVAGKAWSRISPRMRTAVMTLIRTGATANQAITITLPKLINAVRGVMLLPESLGELREMNRQILRNQELIMEQLDEIKIRLKIIDAKLDEQILVKSRKGHAHLLNALNSEVRKVRDQQFQLASDAFSMLTQLHPGGITKGIPGRLSNDKLIAIGYRGNFVYFSMMGDKRNALAQVYECTWKIPLTSLKVFPPRFFSKDYGILFEELSQHQAIAKGNLDNIEAGNRSKSWRYSFKWATRQVAGAVTGLTIGGISSALGFPAGALLGVAAYKGISGGIEPPKYDDPESLRKFLQELSQQQKKLSNELAEECQLQLDILRLVKPSELMKMTAA